ncbi:hypothetical protein DFQ30_005256 [Apophysomyces sp. BC1015]|nr:hypothetical protein DFQ30_005256 [Apophysomyces sp. BC1015]
MKSLINEAQTFPEPVQQSSLVTPKKKPINRQPPRVRAHPYRYRRLEQVNLDDIAVNELKSLLRDRGLSVTGRKTELVQRIRAVMNESSPGVFMPKHGPCLASSLTDQFPDQGTFGDLFCHT